jgi:drug/metabolite transporter (DMT)-like permease
MDDRRKGLLAATAGGALWGTIGIFNTLLGRQGLDPLSIVTIRMSLATVMFAVLIGLTRPALFRVDRRDLPLLIVAGLFSVAGFSFLFSFTIQQSSVATAVVLQFMAPVYVVLVGALLFRERVTRAKLLALALALIGAFLSVGGLSPGALLITPIGLLAGIGTGIVYALYSLSGKALSRKYEALTILIHTFTIGAAVLILVWLPTHPGGVHLTATGWALEVGLALVPTVIAYGLYNYGLRRIEAGQAALACTAEPVVGVLAAWLVLAEPPSLSQLLGGLAILGAVLVISLAPASSTQQPQRSEEA